MLLAAHLGLLLTFDLAAHPLPTLLCWLAGFMALGLAVRALRPLDAAGGLGAGHILWIAAALRLLVLPLPPTLSNDVLRYVWDGRVVLSGHDPYALAPDAEVLLSLRDELWSRMDHRDVPTVYPPLAQSFFALAASAPISFSGQILILKGLLGAADLVGCAALVYLARRRRTASSPVLWYAWSPLAVLEGAGMGHVDVLGVAALLVAVALLPRRTLAAAAAVAAGAAAKLVPLLLLPLLGRHSRRPLRFWAAGLGLGALALAPMAVASGGAPAGLLRYGVSWEFNGPLFEPLWRTLDALDTTSRVAGGLDRLKDAFGRPELWNRLYSFNYPQLHAKLLLALLLGCGVAAALRSRDVVAGCGALLGLVLLCSATVYPWYVLWVLPWAALCRQRAWLTLSGLCLLAYLPELFGVALWPWVFAAVWLPFFFLLLRSPRWSTP